MADHIRFVIWYRLWRYAMLMCCAFMSDSVLCRSAHIWKPVLSSLKIDPCLLFVLILLICRDVSLAVEESRISQIDQQKYPIPSSNDLQEDIHPSPTVFKEKSGVSVAKSLTVYPWLSLGCILVPPTVCSEKWRRKKTTLNTNKLSFDCQWCPQWFWQTRWSSSTDDAKMNGCRPAFAESVRRIFAKTGSGLNNAFNVENTFTYFYNPWFSPTSTVEYRYLSGVEFHFNSFQISFNKFGYFASCIFFCLSAMSSSLIWEIIEKHIGWTIDGDLFPSGEDCTQSMRLPASGSISPSSASMEGVKLHGIFRWTYYQQETTTRFLWITRNLFQNG